MDGAGGMMISVCPSIRASVVRARMEAFAD